MIKKLEEHILYINNFDSQDIDEIESMKIKFLGRKGLINELFSDCLLYTSDAADE